MSTEEILQKLGVKEDEYMNALGVSKQGTTIVLKHNPRDMFLNACNIDILAVWGGNMDLQPVVDEVGAVIYIVM